jgi:hypothetical protein
VLTLHRPSNVDTPETLQRVLDAVMTIADDMPVVFPASADAASVSTTSESIARADGSC